MSISIVIVITLTVCRLYTHIGAADTAKPYHQKYTQVQYEGYIEGEGGEDTKDYQQRTTQPVVKVNRDDNIAVNPAAVARPPPNNPYTSNAAFNNLPDFGGHSQNLNSAIGPDHSSSSRGNGFGLTSSKGGGARYSYSGGGGRGSNFGQHEGSPSSSTSHDTGGGGGYFGGGGSDSGYENLEPIIHKSVYVHVAPPEEEAPPQKVIVPRIAPKQNYQIVFIRPPAPPPPSVPVIPQFPPQSDKTLIYVLHPKAEAAPPIHIPAPPQNLPAKPDVYFVKYKSKEGEAGHGGFDEFYRRRFGGRRREDEHTEEESTLGIIDTENKAVLPDSDVPLNQYEEDDVQNDSSGESSDNIVRIYSIKERGKNAH